jgi:hypothetical protein
MSHPDHDPRSLGTERRRGWLIVLIACAAGFVIGLLGMSYYGAERMDESAQKQGLPGAVPPQDQLGQARTTGSNAPAASPQQQR